MQSPSNDIISTFYAMKSTPDNVTNLSEDNQSNFEDILSPPDDIIKSFQALCKPL